MQAAGNQKLDFRPDVDAKNPTLIVASDGKIGKICRRYEVVFKLTKLNDSLSNDVCRYQNVATGKSDVRSVKLSDLQRKIPASAFPFEWPKDRDENQESNKLI